MGFSKGDWILFRSYGQGGTLGKLGNDWDGNTRPFLEESYYVKSFTVKDKVGGCLATLSIQAPTDAEVFGGGAAVLDEDSMAMQVSDSIAKAIKACANK